MMWKKTDKVKDKEEERQAKHRERDAARKVRQQEIERYQTLVKKRKAYKISLDNKEVIYSLDKPDTTTKWSNVSVLKKWSWFLSACSHYVCPYSSVYFLEGGRVVMVNSDHIASIECEEIDFADDFIPETSYEDMCTAI